MINIKRHKVADILDKMQFFQGSMAGRELWFDKPKEVQAQDCDNFTRDIRTIRDYILQIEEQANKKVDNWIPCSERLPEDETLLYWTTHEDGSLVLHGYKKSNGFIYNWEVDDLEKRKRQGQVIAWIPIFEPTSYNEKRGGKNERKATKNLVH